MNHDIGTDQGRKSLDSLNATRRALKLPEVTQWEWEQLHEDDPYALDGISLAIIGVALASAFLILFGIGRAVWWLLTN